MRVAEAISFAAAVHLLSLGGFGQALGADLPRSPRATYESCEDCKGCHEQIYDSWAKSMHASASVDLAFQIALEAATTQAGDEARDNCLHCHSPTTRLTRDYALDRPISREGITCDFCHSVTAIDVKVSPPALICEPGGVKCDPSKPAGSSARPARRAQLLGGSEFCGACHEYANARGIGILETYTEWKAGPYPGEGIECQDCHMRDMWAVTLSRVRGSRRSSHTLPGGHARVAHLHAASVQVEAERIGKHVLADVSLINTRAGHMIPTGTAGRRAVLSLSAHDGDNKLIASERRVYQRTLVDEDGRALETVTDQMLHAAAVGHDNRIAPRERRTEQFRFAVPARVRGPLTVTASLSYELETPVGLERYYMDGDAARVDLPPWKLWRNAAGFGVLCGLGTFLLLRYWFRLGQGRSRSGGHTGQAVAR